MVCTEAVLHFIFKDSCFTTYIIECDKQDYLPTVEKEVQCLYHFFVTRYLLWIFRKSSYTYIIGHNKFFCNYLPHFSLA